MRQYRIGVRWYSVCTNTDAWVSKLQGLTSGEWTNALKMSMNSMANCGIGVRNEEYHNCRHVSAVRIKLSKVFPTFNVLVLKWNSIETLHIIRSIQPSLISVQRNSTFTGKFTIKL